MNGTNEQETGLRLAEERQEEISRGAEAIVVKDAESYRVASETRKAIAAMVEQIRAAFRPIIRATHAAWQEALAKEKGYLRPWADADERLKAKIGGYLLEERRKAEAAEAERQAALRGEARNQQEAIDRGGALDQAGKRAEASRIPAQGAGQGRGIQV